MPRVLLSLTIPGTSIGLLPWPATNTIRFTSTRRPVEYFELSNFSPHGFKLDRAYWPTVEHYFQAQKFPDNPDYQEKIRIAPTPKDAKQLGRSRKAPIHADWEAVKDHVMRKALRAKFTSHPGLVQLRRPHHRTHENPSMAPVFHAVA
jgi:ribA/ribD-fused uncharacterized protein